jgi:hypothetical protein
VAGEKTHRRTDVIGLCGRRLEVSGSAAALAEVPKSNVSAANPADASRCAYAAGICSLTVVHEPRTATAGKRRPGSPIGRCNTPTIGTPSLANEMCSTR